MRNNKGFATTFILFGLLILFLMIMSVLMFTLNNSSSLNNKLKNGLLSNIDDMNLQSSSYSSNGVFTAKTKGSYKVQAWSKTNSGTRYYATGAIQLDKNDKLNMSISDTSVLVRKGTSATDYIELSSARREVNGSFENRSVLTSPTDTIPTCEKGDIAYVTIQRVVTASEVVFDDNGTNLDCDTVQCALEQLAIAAKGRKAICKKATSLHEAYITYNGTSTTVVSYGTLIRNRPYKVLYSGDAFDCDLTGDGNYNERFYYISDYYDTTSSSFDEKYATLLYYTNVNYGVASNTTSVAYNSDNVNYNGPVDAYKHLPTEVQWPNIRLKDKKRLILNDQGTRTIDGEENKTKFFNYTGYAARFLTYKELKHGCSNASTTVNSLNSCTYLLENTVFENEDYKAGYWLESPYTSHIRHVWNVSGGSRFLSKNNANVANSRGVRPAIDVKKEYLDY